MPEPRTITAAEAIREAQDVALATDAAVCVIGEGVADPKGVFGNWLIGEAAAITEARIANAAYYDDALAKIPQITLPRRDVNSKIVYHLYMVFAEGRDGLYAHLRDRGIECKVHYPIPLHRQQGLAHLGYRAGDFPVAERHAAETITLPVDQHLSRAEMDYVIDTVRGYYAAG